VFCSSQLLYIYEKANSREFRCIFKALQQVLQFYDFHRVLQARNDSEIGHVPGPHQKSDRDQCNASKEGQLSSRGEEALLVCTTFYLFFLGHWRGAQHHPRQLSSGVGILFPLRGSETVRWRGVVASFPILWLFSKLPRASSPRQAGDLQPTSD
jgi:hypothetical protein